MRAVRFSILFLISATVEDVEVTEDLSQQVALQNVRTFPEGGAANAPEMRELPRPLAAPAIVSDFNIRMAMSPCNWIRSHAFPPQKHKALFIGKYFQQSSTIDLLFFLCAVL
jgi:hypothetical protein